jgi:hypothetical protein
LQVWGNASTLTPTAVYSALHYHTHTHTHPAEARRPLCVSSAHLNGGGTAPFGLPLCSPCPVLPQPRMTGHRLTWRPSSFDAAFAHWASVHRGQPRSTCSTCAALPSSIYSACRRRAIPVAEERTVANDRDVPTTTATATTRCVEIAAPPSFHLAHRPPLRVPGGMRAGRWFKLLLRRAEWG